MPKKRKLALKGALEILQNFDGLTLNEVEHLSSESETMKLILIIIVNKMHKRKGKLPFFM